MARKGKKRGKIRIDFRPNLEKPGRKGSTIWTKRLQDEPLEIGDAQTHEALKGKGKLARKKTVDQARTSPAELERWAEGETLSESQWREGTVVAIFGLYIKVDDGKRMRNCVVRRVLKSLLLDQRNVATVGDHVSFTPIGDEEGVIERIGERHGRLLRRYRHQEHLIVTNIDQALIIASVAEPGLRIHLVDRYIVAALAGSLKPVIVFNKVDLPHDEPLDEYEQVYASLGYKVLRTSVAETIGLETIRDVMKDRKSVLAGVSGVGKSSLVNAIEPGLSLAVHPVNRATGRGTHTTTLVQLLKLSFGGYVVDTPGIRQFAFWNIDRRNMEMYFEEFLPYVPQCKFADCIHIHEDNCAVKQAVEDEQIAAWRYDSYAKIFDDQMEFLETWEK
jgi:ribosome biogenesis GTPase